MRKHSAVRKEEIESGARAAHRTTKDMHRKVHDITDRLAMLSDEAIDSIEARVRNLNDQSQEYREMAETYIQKHPLKSVGWALLAGALAATLLRLK